MRVLFVFDGSLTKERSGPAIRCLELAQVIAQQHEVTVATSQKSDLEADPIRIRADLAQNRTLLGQLAREHDVVITQGLVLTKFPFLRRAAKFLVIDLYDPYLLEYLAHPHPRLPELGFLRQLHSVNRQLMQGDFFLCANESQKDYWLGALGALGRLDPSQYARDPSFSGLVGIVPFGMPSQPPRKQRSALRDAIPTIRPGDTVLLWAGGIWDWLDPLVIIQAVAEISKTRSDIKLVFLGTRDPNPNNRAMSMLGRCKAESKAMGVLDETVIFLEGWVPYDERQNYLLDADIGLSAHPDTIESRFSFRTRILDYLWTGLPMIVSQGDGWSEYISDKRLGMAVPMGDVAAWQAAIPSLVDDGNERAAIRRRIAALAPNFHWKTAAASLVEFCNHPYRGNSVPRVRQLLAPAMVRLFESWRRLR